MRKQMENIYLYDSIKGIFHWMCTQVLMITFSSPHFISSSNVTLPDCCKKSLNFSEFIEEKTIPYWTS